MKNISFFLIAMLVIGFLLGILLPQFFFEKPLGFGGFNRFGAGEITASVVEVSSSTPIRLLTASEDRLWTELCLGTSTASTDRVNIFLYNTTTTMNLGEGILLDGGDCFEISSDNLYTGAIWALSSTTVVSNIGVTEAKGYPY